MWLFYNKTNDEFGTVNLIYYEQPPEELLEKDYVVVEDLPEPEILPRKNPVLRVNLQDQTTYYDYIDRALTQEEIMEEQNAKIDLLLQMQMSTMEVI